LSLRVVVVVDLFRFQVMKPQAVVVQVVFFIKLVLM
jgi:hypothetical protein